MGHSRYEGLRCPHCAGKLPGYVSRDAELARIRELTMVDKVVRLQNQFAGAVGDLMCREQEIKTLCGLLERAYRICGPDGLAEEIRTTLDALGGQ